MANIIITLPTNDFDPTEVAIPWSIFKSRGHNVIFATPNGKRGFADPRMVTGKGLGPLAPMLMAKLKAVETYETLVTDPNFLKPIKYEEIQITDFEILILPGGHAQGMKTYLESSILQKKVAEFFGQNKIVGAICHGTVLAARSKGADGRSVLFGKKTTGLPKWMELSAWGMTFLWLGSYYRTYSATVQGEVTDALSSPDDFKTGPYSFSADKGFTVRDGNYVSARWPGDAHDFANEILKLLNP